MIYIFVRKDSLVCGGTGRCCGFKSFKGQYFVWYTNYCYSGPKCFLCSLQVCLYSRKIFLMWAISSEKTTFIWSRALDLVVSKVLHTNHCRVNFWSIPSRVKSWQMISYKIFLYYIPYKFYELSRFVTILIKCKKVY